MPRARDQYIISASIAPDISRIGATIDAILSRRLIGITGGMASCFIARIRPRLGIGLGAIGHNRRRLAEAAGFGNISFTEAWQIAAIIEKYTLMPEMCSRGPSMAGALFIAREMAGTTPAAPCATLA